MRPHVLRPPVPYFGSKQQLATQLVRMFPPHRRYVEPFAGSLAVLFAKTPTPIEIANDIDGRLMTFWRVLRDRPEELLRVCELTPHSRSELAASSTTDNHRELATYLNAATATATVLVSGYATPLYDQLYAGWFRYEIQPSTTQGINNPNRTEIIWANRALPHPTEQITLIRNLINQRPDPNTVERLANNLAGYPGIVELLRR